MMARMLALAHPCQIASYELFLVTHVADIKLYHEFPQDGRLVYLVGTCSSSNFSPANYQRMIYVRRFNGLLLCPMLWLISGCDDGKASR